MRAIEELKYQYAAYCDSGYDLEGLRSIFIEGLRSIFIPDGRWIANGFGAFTGHEEICRFFAELTTTVVQVLHYVTGPRIVVADDGQRAAGRFYLLCLSKSRRREDPSVVDSVATLGTYEDQFVKREGRWLFEEMKVNVARAFKIPPFHQA